MNSYDRTPYYDQVFAEYTAHLLKEQSSWIALCSFCRYFYCVGGYDDDADAGCEHPLYSYETNTIPFESASEGGDCWAFRPEWGAACSTNKHSYPDYDRPEYKAKSAPGKRIAELIEIGQDRQLELRERHTREWYKAHPQWCRSADRDPETGMEIVDADLKPIILDWKYLLPAGHAD